MGLIKFEEKEYDFDWKSIILFAILAPLLSVVFFFYLDWIWLHEITAKLTVDSLNWLTGAEHMVIFVEYDAVEPWKILIVSKETGFYLPRISFTTMCTGIHAVLMFVFVTLFTPHSKIQETTKDIWPRKIKAMTITSLLFYFVNVARMWLQLYLYSDGHNWDDIHYSISAASSFIAIAAILIIHKYVPEFIMTLLWIGDEVKAKFGKKDVEQNINSDGSQDEDEEISESSDNIEINCTDSHNTI